MLLPTKVGNSLPIASIIAKTRDVHEDHSKPEIPYRFLSREQKAQVIKERFNLTHGKGKRKKKGGKKR